jgi:hypothetical protein
MPNIDGRVVRRVLLFLVITYRMLSVAVSLLLVFLGCFILFFLLVVSLFVFGFLNCCEFHVLLGCGGVVGGGVACVLSTTTKKGGDALTSK